MLKWAVEYLHFFSVPFEKPTEMPKRNTNKIIPVLATSKDCKDLANKKIEFIEIDWTKQTKYNCET